MRAVFDAFRRALAGVLHPVVLLLALLPMVLASVAVFAAGWFFWEDAVAAVRSNLQSWELLDALSGWLHAVGGGAFHAVLAPLLVVALALPIVVIVTLLLVAGLLAPALVQRVAQRRFPVLERRGGAAAAVRGLAWSLGHALVALLALLLTLPLWLVPPLGLVLPALIWGWLTARVLAHGSLVAHADDGERRVMSQLHRWPFLAMGVLASAMGSAPTLLWLLGGAASVVFAPLLVVVASWVYTGVFAFATLWFAHFTLASLQALRAGAVSSIGAALAGTGRSPQQQNSGTVP